MQLKSRQKLGKYRIQRLLAEGGFAEIYKAHDTIEGQLVALKVPHGSQASATALDEIRDEVRLTAPLDHPNILPIKNAQFIDGHFCIAYPLGEGTLEDRMRKRLSFKTRVDLAGQLLEAVAYAHARRIIHCDIKPDNLILFSEHRLRLADFGISKLAVRNALASGSGTIGYVAPEQAMGRTSLRSDVFSLGLVLYELFSGELPEWPFASPLPGHKKLKGRVTPEFIALLQRAIRVDQFKRFPDARKMLAAFRTLERAGRILSVSPGRSAARSKPKTRSTSTRDWKELRKRQFERAYKQTLDLRHQCGRCQGPMSEAMHACPWCGNAPKTFRGKTRLPARCPRCRRGRKLDWKSCAWCYGPGFSVVSPRSFTDRAYTERCMSPGCGRRPLMPFMRYCPWCRSKTHKAWKIPGSKHSCGGCGWGVLPDYWSHCPWCAKKQSPH